MVDIEDMLSGEDERSDHFKILQELTNAEKVGVFSEMDDNEIKAFTKLQFLSRLLKDRFGKKILDLEFLLKTFLELRVNLSRKSRGEFVNAFSSERTARIENKTLQQAQQFIR